MKTIIALILFATFVVSAEIPNQGKATYKQTLNNHLSMPASQAAMKAFIPEFSYMQIEILYKNNVLTPKMSPYVEGEKSIDHPPMRIDTLNKSTKILDPKKKTMQQFGTLMEINYRLEQKGENTIKLLDESKEIKGYQCKKAVIDDTIIWYQPNSVAIIPDQDYLLVPGLVVKVEDKKFSYELLSLTAQKVEDSVFSIPTDYKKITLGQFQDLQDEALEEMMKSMGGGSKMIRIGED